MDLRLVIKAVLKKHGIDDLALECELATTIQDFKEKIVTRDAEIVRKEIEAAFLIGQDDNRGKDQLASYVKDKLSINPTGPELEARWGRFYDYAFTRGKEHDEKIEVFVKWWLRNNSNPAYWSPERMITMWPQAFKDFHEPVQPEPQDKLWADHL